MSKVGISFMSILVSILAGYTLLLGAMYLFQSRLLFLPSSKLMITPEEAGIQAEDLWIETEDVIRLHGWYFPHPESQYVVVLSHGNAGNISNRIDIARLLHRVGASVVLYDYRGYGESGGKPSEEGLYRDIEAVVYHLKQEFGFSEDQMIMYGRSLGGAVASYAATRFDVRGLVLDSTFKNLRAMVGELYPFVPSALAKYEFPTEEYLRAVSGLPVMIMHSPDDRIIRFHQGEYLYTQAGEPKRFVRMRGGHNECFHASIDIFEKNWRAFLQELEDRTGKPQEEKEER